MVQSEQILAEKIQQGDVESMAEYLSARRRDLLAVILSKMGPALKRKVEAEDVFQEISQTAVENFRAVTFTERGPFGWLCELIDRKIIDIQRRFSAQKRDAAKEVGIHGSPDQSQVGLVNLLVASITSPSRAFSRKQKEFQLLTAMDRLSLEQKTVLELRYAEGKSSKVIAAKIGKSDGATRVLITRSLSKLKKLIDEEPES